MPLHQAGETPAPPGISFTSFHPQPSCSQTHASPSSGRDARAPRDLRSHQSVHSLLAHKLMPLHQAGGTPTPPEFLADSNPARPNRIMVPKNAIVFRHGQSLARDRHRHEPM
jgi:hypothetical protein